MSSEDDFEEALAKVCVEWNKAENVIKLAEQVNGEIVNPSIYELRYAGRRLVEACNQKANNLRAALDLLSDAHFDCCRARHDAVDAVTSKVASDLDIAVAKIGPKIVLSSFSELPELFDKLTNIRDKIAKSRENREDRDAIYDVLASDDIVTIVALHQKFKASEKLMLAAAEKDRSEAKRNKIFGQLGIIIGIIGIVLSVIFYIQSS